jgi:MoxR-like ATPase
LFEPAALSELHSRHKETLGALVELEDRLNRRFFGMQNAVHGLILAVLTGEALVMIGPPGTAKSRLIRSFCNVVGLLDDSVFRKTDADNAESAGAKSATDQAAMTKSRERYFEYLLTQFTEPSELFGFFDLSKLFAADGSQREFKRQTDGMMQKAEVVFLDEVFNASSAILNALLTFMNERKFHDRGTITNTPLRLLVSATNQPPREEGLTAVYDRFLLRVWLSGVETKDVADLIRMGWSETHASRGAQAKGTVMTGVLDGVKDYQDDVDRMTDEGRLDVSLDPVLIAKLNDVITDLRKNHLSDMSNRRIIKFVGVILAEALVRHQRQGRTGSPAVEIDDLQVILDYSLDAQNRQAVDRMRQLLLGR